MGTCSPLAVASRPRHPSLVDCRMKFNISYPATGCQKVIDIDDDHRAAAYYDCRMGQEVPGEPLGEEFAGYVFRISGGNDKQGFPMKQGVLIPKRTRLLLSGDHTCFTERRKGYRRRKSVRGCIVQSDISVLNLVILKKGPGELPGITDVTRPRRLGPKRASNIRKLFNLTKDDDVTKFVIRREINKEGKKAQYKAPKIQRLVTPVVLQRKRKRRALKKAKAEKARAEAEAYASMLRKRIEEKKAARAATINKKKQKK